MRSVPLLLLLVALCACGGEPREEERPGAPGPTALRIALFNVRELSAEKLLDLDAAGVGQDPQLRAAAAIVRRVRPDVLILNEIDFDAGAPDDPVRNARRFVEGYLLQPTRPESPESPESPISEAGGPIAFPHLFAAPSNTGLLSGFDLDNDGRVATQAELGDRAHGGDSWGFGIYPGQYAMALLSRFPIAASAVRTFQRFRWRDLPGHHLPGDFYTPEEAAQLRLSSKSHWDVPLQAGATTLHLWISHPTPPVFDGDEDRNGRRNFDEVGFWVAYLENETSLYDDQGRSGGFGAHSPADSPFVIAGDLNAHLRQTDSLYDGRTAISQLLEHPEIQDTGEWCKSAGGLAGRHPGPPDYRERSTYGFMDGVRLDYLLPRRGIRVTGGGVFWPAPAEDPEGHRLAESASDHRLVWLDLELP